MRIYMLVLVMCVCHFICHFNSSSTSIRIIYIIHCVITLLCTFMLYTCDRSTPDLNKDDELMNASMFESHLLSHISVDVFKIPMQHIYAGNRQICITKWRINDICRHVWIWHSYHLWII